MSWNFPSRIRFNDLPKLEGFTLNKEVPPEPLGKGKYRVVLFLEGGERKQMTTFESTIGDMIAAGALKHFVKAVKTEEGYINFEAAEK